MLYKYILNFNAIKIEVLKNTCDDILHNFRMLSNPVPLVNIAKMCQKNWHTLARVCQNVCQILLISNIFVYNKAKRKQPELCL